MIETQPATFYLTRLCPEPLINEQGASAAVGSAFDAYIKAWLCARQSDRPEMGARALGRAVKGAVYYQTLLRKPESLLDVLLDCSVDQRSFPVASDTRAELIDAGRRLCDLYVNALSLDSVLKSILAVELNEWTVIDGIPIMGKPDAVLRLSESDDIGCLPFDWKVVGYGSDQSPKKGYYNIIADGCHKGAHKDGAILHDMRLIDNRWNDQLAAYGWLTGRKVGKEFNAYVDCLVMRSTGTRIARYKSVITSESQLALIDRYKKVWSSLSDGSYLASLPDTVLGCSIMAMTESWY
jgi:hypothetical protein